MEKFRAKKKSDGQVYRYTYEDVNTVFVYAPRQKRRGWRMSKQVFSDIFEIIPENHTEKWHRRIRNVLKKLEASGLWPELVPLYESLLKITWEDLAGMRSEYWEHHRDETYRSIYTDKYPFAYTPSGKGGTVLSWDYVTESADCRTKSMYFGTDNSHVKGQIKKALSDKTDYHTGCIPVNYDVSFDYNAGKKKAWYSEEYKGCGNGHYYLAVDHNTAVFCEDD